MDYPILLHGLLSTLHMEHVFFRHIDDILYVYFYFNTQKKEPPCCDILPQTWTATDIPVLYIILIILQRNNISAPAGC
mgnify:CR=1 FL=1